MSTLSFIYDVYVYIIYIHHISKMIIILCGNSQLPALALVAPSSRPPGAPRWTGDWGWVFGKRRFFFR